MKLQPDTCGELPGKPLLDGIKTKPYRLGPLIPLEDGFCLIVKGLLGIRHESSAFEYRPSEAPVWIAGRTMAT